MLRGVSPHFLILRKSVGHFWALKTQLGQWDENSPCYLKKTLGDLLSEFTTFPGIKEKPHFLSSPRFLFSFCNAKD